MDVIKAEYTFAKQYKQHDPLPVSFKSFVLVVNRYGGGIAYSCRCDGTLVMPSYSFSIVWYGSPFLKRQMMV